MDTFNNDQEREINEWLAGEESTKFFVDKSGSDRMDMNFYRMLDGHRKPVKNIKPWIWFLRVAVPMFALLMAFFIGRNFSMENASVLEKDFATELLKSNDAGDKINLVSTAKIQDNSDDKMIDALLFSLSNDESVNVRLACINTLYDYAYMPKVRSGLIQAVSNQNSPLVVANLAEAINASGKKLSKEEFMGMISKDLPPPIKSSIDASLIKI